MPLGSRNIDDHIRHRSSSLSPLAACLRRVDRDPDPRCAGGRRPRPRLSPQAQFLRSGRRHRARGRLEPHPLRAPGGARGGRYQRAGAGVLVGRQHLHAGPGEPFAKGQFLQIHQRDPKRHRGFERAFGAQIPRRGQRRLRRRRLRAGARLRRDRHDRRPVEHGEPARGAAPGRAARHRRADPPRRQAQGAPRPRRCVLHHRRGGARRPRQGMGPRRSDGAACPLQGARRGARAGARGRQRPPGRCRGCRAAAARPPDRRGRVSLPLGYGRDRARRADRDGDGRRAALRRRAGRSRRHPRRRSAVVAVGDGARIGRRAAAAARQRARNRHPGAEDSGRCRGSARLRRRDDRASGSLARARDDRPSPPHLATARRLLAQPLRGDRRGLVLCRQPL